MVTGDKSGFDGTVLIHVFEQDGLTDRWFVMDSFATVPVSTGSDFIKEWTVYLVHLGTIHF